MVRCWRGYLSGARCRLAYAQLMPLPLTVSCFSKIQIGFTFLVPAHLGSPGKRAVKRVCVCVCVCTFCGSILNLQTGMPAVHKGRIQMDFDTGMSKQWPDLVGHLQFGEVKTAVGTICVSQCNPLLSTKAAPDLACRRNRAAHIRLI